MKKTFFILSLLVSVFSYSQVNDEDKDGIPDSEDLCPLAAGNITNKGCPSNDGDKTVILSGELTEQDKKTFIANFQKVLSHIPAKFQKLKAGEEDWDITNRISWFKSNLQLFPSYTDKSKTQLMYGTYSGKSVISFIENAPVDVNTIVDILWPVLKQKGMVEVNTKFVMDDPAARSFRSKDAVLQINSVATGGSTLSIGKIPYYYESDVKPIGLAKSKSPGKPVSSTPPPQVNTLFIEPSVFEDLLETVCKNSVHLKIKDKIQPLDNVVYTTSFPTNGYKRNLPVLYKQANKNNFSTIIGLSENLTDLDKAANYINSLFVKVSACNKTYRTFKLTFDATTGKYADVSAWGDGGMFVYIEKENGLVQLRINKINYTEEEKKNINKPAPSIVHTACNDMEIILKECILGFKNVKGSFVKKETPASYYNTSLPALGFEKIFVVESMNIDIQNGEVNRKPVIYYSADQDFTSSEEALKIYDKIKAVVKQCFSGSANSTDDKNQKIYEFFTDYKGKKIRITIIYLNFFSSSVSVSVKLAD